MPGEIGLYLKDKLSPLLYRATKGVFAKLLEKKVTLPLSILCLVPYLKQAGYEVVAVDGRVEDSIQRYELGFKWGTIFLEWGTKSLRGTKYVLSMKCMET